MHDELDQRYTYEQLSERSRLDMRTVSRLLSCEVKVDKNTFKAFFRAFNLSLEADDYTVSHSGGAHDANFGVPAHTTLMAQRVEFEHLAEELRQLKQCIGEYDRLFQQLGLNENLIAEQTLVWSNPLLNQARKAFKPQGNCHFCLQVSKLCLNLRFSKGCRNAGSSRNSSHLRSHW